ncbi:hypothetical protein [Actinomadura rupiterrae]|uniref:hypothetical protein n=1 Tax=Actinomadura rupiterrae TaxID=559627 RepID=UPI0020A5107D|nr:hypothetical protein [Actinomadura rupiterrae]MCP2340774.1 hypothetical protein [Actinomadura rupiterrae]
MHKPVLAIGAVATALLLTACGGGGKKTAAPSPSDSGSPSASPSDSGGPSGTPSGPATGPTKPGKTTPSDGPLVGPGTKCGTVTVKAGRISCAHAEKVFGIYAQKKTATGSASFSGWVCHHTTAPKGTSCTRSGVTIHSPE